jgi:hypothetical protein
MEGDVLILGCGLSALPECIAYNFPLCTVTGYDLDTEKIAQQEGILQRHLEAVLRSPFHPPPSSLTGRVCFTAQRPAQQFSAVLSIAAFHEDPLAIVEETLHFSQGLIGVLDYDMKGVPVDDFFQRWGFVRHEKRERAQLGDAESYQRHTRTGLDNCVNAFTARGVQTKVALGKLDATGVIGFLPTQHFLYVGRLG